MAKHINFDYIYFQLITRWNTLFNRNKDIVDLKRELNAYRYLKKHFKKYFFIDTKDLKYNGNNINKKIWFCWFTGLDNAPELIKICYKSVIISNPGLEVELITAANFRTFVDMPLYIIEKWENGIISDALFSDLLRLELLIKYGGIWVDATCYFTKPIPKEIIDSHLFMFNNERKRSKIKCSNWFISSVPQNAILIRIKEILYLYWKKNNAPIHYFIFHLIYSLIIEENSKIKDDILVIPNMGPLLMNNLINCEYSVKQFSVFCELSFVHKLNRKTLIVKKDYDTVYSELIRRVENEK